MPTPRYALLFSIFQSTHPVRGATLGSSLLTSRHKISIHAPREGCDPVFDVLQVADLEISIHAPREGCDPKARSKPSQAE